MVDIILKKCTVCGENKPETKEFFQFMKNTNLFRNQCKGCQSKYQKEYVENHKKEIKEYKKEYYQDNKEIILEQQKKYYQENIVKIIEYKANNKEKIAAGGKKYKANNKEKISAYNKEYKENNKEKTSVYNKEYKENNKEIIREKRAEYERERKLRDPAYKLRKTVSIAIYNSLKKAGSSKRGYSCFKYLPYSKEELKQYLENQFEPWMSWENYGMYNYITHDNHPTWNIDHIIPQSSLPYSSMEEENFQKCWALSNLRPLSSKENLLKGNKIIF
jgi:hypothetical protein